MAHIFLSYASPDQTLALEMTDWLHQNGFDSIFIDSGTDNSINVSEDWERRLYREVERCEAIIIILTPEWLASKWCFAEFTQARALGKAIFPVIETPIGDRLVSQDIQHLDLQKDREGGLERLAKQLSSIAVNAQNGFEWDRRRSPFPGLMSFDEADASVYFGRDDDIRRVIEKLNARRAQGGTRLTVLLGASGCGKSSLMRAGIIPRLKLDGNRWIVLPVMRPQADPVAELATVIAMFLPGKKSWRQWKENLESGDCEGTLSKLSKDIREYCEAADAEIIIPIDQGEELFGIASEEATRKFMEFINVACMGQFPFRILLTMRADFLGSLQSANCLQAAFEEVSLKPISLSRIGQIVEGPARVAGVTVDPKLILQLLRDAQTADALPLVAFMLRTLYDGLNGQHRITSEAYVALADPTNKLSPLEHCIRQVADDVIKQASATDDDLIALRNAIIPAMVRVNSDGEYTRRPAQLRKLPTKSLAIIKKLVDARLLVLRHEFNTDYVEVVHEALLRKWPKLVGWLNEEREFLIGKARLESDLDDWQQQSGSKATQALLRGIKLSRATQWLEDHPEHLTNQEKAFINASIAEDSRVKARYKRLQNFLTWGSVAATITLSVFAIVLAFQKQAINDEKNRAVAALLTNQAKDHLTNGDVEFAVLNSLKAHSTRASSITRSSLLQTVTSISPHLVASLSSFAQMPSVVAWGGDNTDIAIGGQNGSVFIWSPKQLGKRDKSAFRQIYRPTNHHRNPIHDKTVQLVWLPNADSPAIVSRRGIVTQFSSKPTQVELGPVRSIGIADLASVSMSGRTAITYSFQDEKISIFNCESSFLDGQCNLFKFSSTGVSTIALNETETTFALGSEDGKVAFFEMGGDQLYSVFADVGTVTSIGWHKSGKFLIAGSVSGKAAIISSTGNLIQQLPNQKNSISAVAWSANFEFLATACDPFSICVWKQEKHDKVVKFRLHSRLNGHRNTITSISWSDTSDHLVSASTDGTVNIWSVLPVDPIVQILTAPDQSPLWDIAQSPDEKKIAASTEHGSVVVWGSGSFEVENILQGTTKNKLKSLLWGKNSDTLAASGLDGRIHFWKLSSLQNYVSPLFNTESIEKIDWMPDSECQHCVVGVLRDGSVVMWRSGATKAVEFGGKHKGAAIAVVSNFKRDEIITSDTKGEIFIWNARTKNLRGKLPSSKEVTGSEVSRGTLVLGPHNRVLLATGNDGKILTYDLEVHGLIKSIQAHNAFVEDIDVSPKGNLISSIDSNGFLKVWSFPNLDPVFSARISTYLAQNSIPSTNSTEPIHLRELLWLADSKRIGITNSLGQILIISIEENTWIKRATSTYDLVTNIVDLSPVDQ